MRMLVVAGGCAAVLAGPLGAAAAEADPSLASRLRRIESAFRSGDAAALRPSFAAGKVRVDLRDLTDGPGSFGSGQLEVLFGRIFDASPTREFTIRPQDVTVSTPSTAFARGRWVRRPRHGAPE